MHIIQISLIAFFLLLANRQVIAAGSVVDQRIHHLRAGAEREWDSFTGTPQKQLTITFDAKEYSSETTLSLRQQDVKARWVVNLNGHELGKLDQDENARVRYLSVPPNALKATGNILTIQCIDLSGKAELLPDDILVGDIQLLDRPEQRLLEEVQVNVSVLDKGLNHPVPSRITITTLQMALQPVRVTPGQPLAVRTGCIYTGNGKASFSLPEGKYKLYASRGFEYSVDSLLLEVKKDKPVNYQFILSKEVPTQGWVSSDTHIHTFTNSGHGDATVEERLLSIAGEGIDLPVFTDHNMVYDAKPLIRKMGLDTVFTPITGNEFTTKVGHFNVFPLADDAKTADHQVKDWTSVSKALGSNKQVIVLNHGRNIFYNFQPFGPSRHISIAGQDLDGWQLPANAMEVMNSSAQQRDIMQLYRDWFGLLNRGHFLTPIGSSDSHDVMRYLVGQGRTYIRCEDSKTGKIDVGEATDQLLAGRVMVSFGLLAEIKVNGKYGPGDIAPLSGKDLKISARVLAPSWIKADRITLYANGKKIREARINQNGKNGVKWEGSWTVPAGSQDTYFVAIAEGPDPSHPFWIIPKPYSRVSSVWNPQVIGSSGAVWVDADGDSRKTSAYDYANKLYKHANGSIKELCKELESFDESVGVQIASILHAHSRLTEVISSDTFKHAPQSVKSGFELFVKSLEETKRAGTNK
ncbi:CehA/McbA family metallohydrolase [Dyadobacter sp. CY261]|uniref:CehA/McbA family metallohydrolase n=1 Tax=Dyadobacter sp. CY261 TaxID=2907203 RepID=UPI001F186BC4|nr:CehA/McbA family metallohydrolase [Dyadobacter sp. CY261]MCF0072811.1 CehA/McbA family metallohydrolase [Dyadobacter sp. CY261]